MRVVMQRVSKAQVTTQGHVKGSIGKGWLILVGIHQSDQTSDIEYLARKIATLRAFPDEQGKMDLSLQDIKGEALVVSQFTLYGDCYKGRRPSFTEAAPPSMAIKLYQEFIGALKSLNISVAEGAFQEDMQVTLTNDGPVTFTLDSRSRS